MPGEDRIRKFSRTSREQLICYENFVKLHPLLKAKRDPTKAKQIEKLWIELSEKLNACRGPTRTPAKWKDSMAHWKNQVRSRDRKFRAQRMAMANGSCSQKEYTDNEQQSWSSFSLNGMDDIPVLSTENNDLLEIVKSEILSAGSEVSNDNLSNSCAHKSIGADDNHEESTNSIGSNVKTTDNVLPNVRQKLFTAINAADSKETHPASNDDSESSCDTPSVKSGRKKLTTSDMFSQMMLIMNERQQLDRRLQQSSLKCFTMVAESMNNVATALLSLTKAIEKNISNSK